MQENHGVGVFVNCTVKHGTIFVEFAVRAVAMKECTSDSAGVIASALPSSPLGTLAVHHDRCGCQPALPCLSIIANSEARAARELI